MSLVEPSQSLKEVLSWLVAAAMASLEANLQADLMVVVSVNWGPVVVDSVVQDAVAADSEVQLVAVHCLVVC